VKDPEQRWIAKANEQAQRYQQSWEESDSDRETKTATMQRAVNHVVYPTEFTTNITSIQSNAQNLYGDIK